MANEEKGGGEGVIFKDIRRYYCDYCGICRSKRALITAHVLAHHGEEMKKMGSDEEEELCEKLNVCEICDRSFQKPAHLKQHLQSHSLLRPFICPVEDCKSSYRRKDHLNRHMNQHEGKLFECSVESCKIKFTVQGNMTRHVKEFHRESTSDAIKGPPEYRCKEEGCGKVFRRKDYLASHMHQHEGEFECAVESCKIKFTVEGNMLRHMKEFHNESTSTGSNCPVEFKCEENGCGKVFPNLSRLRKHADSHVKLHCVEALCTETGCMKYFSNEKCLREHISACHQYVNCKECGSQQLKKNIKRHMRKHESGVSQKTINCSFKGCPLTFSTTSNLKQHVKAVHMELKPYICGMPGCSMRFAFKHVRDNHERSGCHVYTPGDFQELDEQFRLRPKGGRKRKYPPFIDTLMRKRVAPPSESDLDGNDCHS